MKPQEVKTIKQHCKLKTDNFSTTRQAAIRYAIRKYHLKNMSRGPGESAEFDRMVKAELSLKPRKDRIQLCEDWFSAYSTLSKNQINRLDRGFGFEPAAIETVRFLLSEVRQLWKEKSELEACLRRCE